MAATPAKGHIFHWLFNAMVPPLAYLESGQLRYRLGIDRQCCRERNRVKRRTDYLKECYGISAIVPVAQNEAVRVPHLKAVIPVPHIPRALQSPLGLGRVGDLGGFIAQELSEDGAKRIYVSRHDARLRRVLNEKSFMPKLESLGFQRAILAELPIARRNSLFRQAEIVVAPHGAGLAHIAWCKPVRKLSSSSRAPMDRAARVRNAT